MNHFGGKEIAQIDAGEIKALVNNRVPEDQHLDYKQVPWEGTDAGRELLHDVTAMANAEGGYLVVGLGTNKVGGQKETEMPTGNIPTYRLTCKPKQVQSGRIDTSDLHLRAILTETDHLRPHGFGFRGVREISSTPTGIKGSGVYSELEVILEEDGYFELRCPLESALFQWRRRESGYPNENWLYPYAVVELPISFLRTARRVYDHAGNSSDTEIQQQFRSLKGFLLVDGHPGNPLFGENVRRFEEKDLIGETYVEPPGFSPEQVAEKLILEVYNSFELSTPPQIEEAWSN